MIDKNITARIVYIKIYTKMSKLKGHKAVGCQHFQNVNVICQRKHNNEESTVY